MRLPSPLRFLQFLSFFLHLHAIRVAAADSERDILLGFKNALTIPPSASRLYATWNATSITPCGFAGVTCVAGSSVSEINLRATGISGRDVPVGSLCSLPALTKLTLSSNGLTGVIDAGIRNCTGLTHLDLSFNHLSGEVPNLSPLNQLRILNISKNHFTGDFPWDGLNNLTDLTVLSLGDNPFAPTATFPSVVTNLTKLAVLYLSLNNIGGEIPLEIDNLVGLRDLELSDNRISGEVPPAITRLTNLYQLELYNNSLTGTLPRGFGNLSKLAYFDASMNNLTGDLSELRWLDKLVSLQLFFNNFYGEVPPEFGDFKYLVNLSLYSNMLTGRLPAKLGSWAEFNFIDVSTNSLTGPIPPYMCARGTMTKLLILENNFTGEIPATYAQCTTLLRFRVSNNSLSGEVPAGIWALPNVNIIDVAGNSLQGSIGAGIGEAKSLNQLFLAGNHFSGQIPEEIGGAAALVLIDASYNELSGELPASIGHLSSLDSLDLEKNAIGGAIPASIGNCSSLSTINLAGNSISGTIPASIGRLSRLNSLDLSDNHISGGVPASLAGLKLSSLDLSNNQLSGPIPAPLSISAYSTSFLGNPGLCTAAHGGDVGLRRCWPGAGGSSPNIARTVITCVLAGSAVTLAALGAVIYLKKGRSAAASATASGRGKPFSKRGSWDLKSFRILAFNEQEVIAGIKDENLIGSGGSGNVYRVKLGSGTVVAVKHIVVNAAAAAATTNAAETAMLGGRAMSRRSSSMRCREFEAEVGTLSSIRHVNVVKLFCSITSDEGASLLVYEHLPNGSLYDRLHTAEGCKLGGLDWPARYDIALGAAKGLEYLHHGCDRPILHRDVKSSNILLDECFKPRIADFGLAKILNSASAAPDSGLVTGTLGYMAPEYGYAWKVTEKSDVYSFGVVLLELVTGRMPIETDCGESKDIVNWVSKRLDSKDRVMSLLDKRISEDWARDEAVRVLRVAVLCTGRLPSSRPSMRTVVQMLEDAGCNRAFAAAAHGKDRKVVEVKVIP